LVDGDDNDADDLSDGNSVASDASFSSHPNSGARRLFRTPSLCPKQKQAVRRIVLDPTSDGKLLVVERTGGEKSLMLYMTAVSVGGIAVVIFSLLYLTANQLVRLCQARQEHGVVCAFNMDDTSDEDLKKRLSQK